MVKHKIFSYGHREIEYLCSRDEKLKEAIEKIGFIEREVEPDLFESLVYSIVGQQISTKAQKTICRRIKDRLLQVTPENILLETDEGLQSLGISFRKVSYIKNAAQKVMSGELNINSLHDKSDEEVSNELSSLKGIGIWTAEMLMIFAMERPNILSYSDLGIMRGLRMLYHHREITPKLFKKYQRRYSPCCSVASLYLWEISNGRMEETIIK